MRKSLLLAAVAVSFACLSVASAQSSKAMPRVCGDPEAACKGRSSFQPYELPVTWPPNSIIAESKPFYAIILKSAKFNFGSDGCDEVYSDREIQNIQNGFPNNKVFASKCAEPGMVYYSGVDPNSVFIAIFAGDTLAQANRFLKTVIETYPGVRVRKMRAGINGT